MADKNKDRVEIDKKHEARTKEISKMIGEGGLGADKYYKIKKHPEDDENQDEQKDTDE